MRVEEQGKGTNEGHVRTHNHTTSGMNGTNSTTSTQMNNEQKSKKCSV